MKERMITKKRSLKWYQGIVFKQMAVFFLLLLPLVAFSISTILMLRHNSLKTVTEAALASDNVVFNTFEENMDSIFVRHIAVLSSGNTRMIESLWNMFREDKKMEYVEQLKKSLEWLKDSFSWIEETRVYMPAIGQVINHKVIKSFDKKDIERMEAVTDHSKVFLNDGMISLATVLYNRNRSATSVIRLTAQNTRLLSEAYPASDKLYTGNDDRDVYMICETILYRYELSSALRAGSIGEQPFRVLAVDDKLCFSEGIELMDVPDELVTKMLEAKNNNLDTVTGITHLNNEQYFYTIFISSRNNISLISMYPYGTFFSSGSNSIKMLFFIAGIYLVVAAAYFLFFRRYIEKPVEILQSSFKKLSRGNYPVIAITKPADEFSQLYQEFNDMSTRLEQTTKTVVARDIEIHRSRLKHLQAQIEPHFLYNSLFIIKARIWNGETEGAMRMTELLGEYYQFLNRDMKDNILLLSEVGHAYTFAQIQNLRFSGRFELDWQNCPAAYEKLLIPRLVIQPLVENAIKYSLENIEEDGLLRVSYQDSGEALLICIESTGKGVTQKEIDQMNERLRNFRGQIEITSTININRRLQLYYGTNFGLRFALSTLGGIKAVVAISTEEREDEDGSEED